MGRATAKGNEVKSKMKHPLDMSMPRFKLRWKRSVVQRVDQETLDKQNLPQIADNILI